MPPPLPPPPACVAVPFAPDADPFQRIDGTIKIVDSRFDLTFGGKANLTTDASQCAEW